jgi:hypothetical protein
MRIAMPSMPESLTYSLVAATGITGLTALVLAASGPGNLVGAVLLLAVAAAIYWLIGRNLATLVTGKDVAGATALLFLVCALADLLTGYPYQAVLFLLAAGSLGFAFLLLQQGTVPVELRLGGVVAVGSSSGLIHLRMIEELRNAGILTADEFAAKRLLVGL